MIKRFFYIFSATLFIMLSSSTGVNAEVMEKEMEALERNLNSPPGFNYQAVLRNSDGSVMASQDVTLRFTITNDDGTLWVETHTKTTDAFGAVTAVIGNGTKTSGSASTFDAIDWGASDASIKVEVNTGDGFVDLGTSGLNSVPYAAYAENGLTEEERDLLAAIPADVSDLTDDSGVIPTSIDDLADGSGDATLSGVFTANELAVAGAFNLPTADGTDGQVLTTDGAGTTSWADVSGAGYTGSGSYSFQVSGPTATPNNVYSNFGAISGGRNNVIELDGAGNYHSEDAVIGGGYGNTIQYNAEKTVIAGGSGNSIESYSYNAVISGGLNNTIYSDAYYSSIGGGNNNSLYSSNGVISGGNNNEIGSSSGYSTIGGGYNNRVAFSHNVTIAGGYSNFARGSAAFVGGGNSNSVYRSDNGTVAGGYNNRVAYSSSGTIAGGYDNTVGNSGGLDSNYGFIGGGRSNRMYSADYSVVTGGYENSISSSSNGVVAGGYGNEISSSTYATLSGGKNNLITGSNYGSISGGQYIYLNLSPKSSAAGGSNHFVWNSNASFIGGGSNNTLGSPKYAANYSTIAGGSQNTIANSNNVENGFIGGGKSNSVNGNYAATLGGYGLQTSSYAASMVGMYNATTGGAFNSAVATDALFVVGNGASDASRSDAMVVLKNGNTDVNGAFTANSLGIDGAFTLPTADGTAGQVLQTDGAGAVTWADAGGASYAGTGSGSFNAGTTSSVTGVRSSIGGGQDNSITNYWSVISGGKANTINAIGANQLVTAHNTIAGGYNNTIDGAYTRDAFIGGGHYNQVSGRSAATVGGWGLQTSSFGATAIGFYNATVGGTPNSSVSTDALFVIGNGIDNTNRSDAFVMLKDGSSTLNGDLQVNGNLAYSGTLTNSSDKRLKTDIKDVKDVLNTLVKLEGYKYKYNDIKATDTESEHYGVIAQEVQKLYPELVKEGEDGYLSVDYMGLIPLLLEAVKELNAQNKSLMAENDQLEEANNDLEARQSNDEARFAELESKINKLMMLMAPVDVANND